MFGRRDESMLLHYHSFEPVETPRTASMKHAEHPAHGPEPYEQFLVATGASSFLTKRTISASQDEPHTVAAKNTSYDPPTKRKRIGTGNLITRIVGPRDRTPGQPNLPSTTPRCETSEANLC